MRSQAQQDSVRKAARVSGERRSAEAKRRAERLQRRDFEAAHAEGEHDEVAREFCPECEAEGRRA